MSTSTLLVILAIVGSYVAGFHSAMAKVMQVVFGGWIDDLTKLHGDAYWKAKKPYSAAHARLDTIRVFGPPRSYQPPEEHGDTGFGQPRLHRPSTDRHVR